MTTLYAILFFCMLSLYNFHRGQTNNSSYDSQSMDSKPNPMTSEAIGDTVKELSHNIMTVYQDKKDNYWFGSW